MVEGIWMVYLIVLVKNLYRMTMLVNLVLATKLSVTGDGSDNTNPE